MVVNEGLSCFQFVLSFCIFLFTSNPLIKCILTGQYFLLFGLIVVSQEKQYFSPSAETILTKTVENTKCKMIVSIFHFETANIMIKSSILFISPSYFFAFRFLMVYCLLLKRRCVYRYQQEVVKHLPDMQQLNMIL